MCPHACQPTKTARLRIANIFCFHPMVAIKSNHPLLSRTHRHTHRLKHAALSQPSIYLPLVSRHSLSLICSLRCSSMLWYLMLCALSCFRQHGPETRRWIKESQESQGEGEWSVHPASSLFICSHYLQGIALRMQDWIKMILSVSFLCFPVCVYFRKVCIYSAIASNIHFSMATRH